MDLKGKVDFIVHDKIIEDLRTLKAIEKARGLKFDRTYKYCTDYKNYIQQEHENPFVDGFYHNGVFYALRFYDGCFAPYLITLIFEEVK